MNPERIRNFAIISHIDHGKSTLADRFLELTNTVPSKKMRPQFLDKMDLEREKGITIKLKPVRMEFQHKGDKYILNLVDTPGHVDFSYEVSRALAAVEGVLLLVDASKGIQAQTLANLELAQQQKLVIIPVINKIDLACAEIEKTTKELANLLKVETTRIFQISAKYGTNIEKLLEEIIERIPPPKKENIRKPFRALVFDSEYDSYQGIIAFVKIVEGKIKAREKIKFLATKTESFAKEIGFFKPEAVPQDSLSAGEIGYIATGIKEPGKIRVGDTITAMKELTEPLPGYREPKPVVFVSIFPQNADDFEALEDSLSKLKLNDPSLIFEQETKKSLGRGFRCGFLGNLHAEITIERIKREFNIELIASVPSVVYKVIDKRGREFSIFSPSDLPDSSEIEKIEEPWVSLEVVTPIEYIGQISEILKNLRGKYIEAKYLGERVVLIYQMPLSEILLNLYDKIKGASRGYASMNYKILDYRPGNLVKIDFLIAGNKEEAFSKIVPQEKAFVEGRRFVKKLKEILPPQQFPVVLQAIVGGKIIARETIRARRKDVTAPLYGGDFTRKKKLLEKQKKGKKELREKAKIKIPSKVFLELIKKE